VPAQNLVDRTIVDVSAVPPQNPVDRTIEPPPEFPQTRLQECGVRDGAALIAIEEARQKPGSLMAATPTTRSWNQFSAFIEEWDKLRMAV
jgi:hypothetical protein